jgi:hypothetical protein
MWSDKYIPLHTLHLERVHVHKTGSQFQVSLPNTHPVYATQSSLLNTAAFHGELIRGDQTFIQCKTTDTTKQHIDDSTFVPGDMVIPEHCLVDLVLQVYPYNLWYGVENNAQQTCGCVWECVVWKVHHEDPK